MKRLGSIAVACSFVVACYAGPTGEDVDDVAVTRQALAVGQTKSLIRKQGSLSSITNEATRQLDTVAYYNRVKIGANGSSGATIAAGLPTLTAFRNLYGFAGNEVVTHYYNRGDLGIGREMHCVDKLVSTGEIACYVRNFAAGDDNTEFTFGMSSSIAFKNANTNHDFATVAMVYRDQMSANAADKVYFVVFNDVENRANAAALDRTGILFATGKNTTSTPGLNFNNHIPSNCAACHGGQYNSTDGQEALTGALFLPFDLDQFEFQNVPGKTRADQLTPFKRQNEMVWKVAVRSGSNPNQAVKKQLDGWYANTSFQADNRTEVFEGNFNSAFVPQGWLSFSGTYGSVVRPMCRGCHITNNFPFDTEASFRTFAPNLATLLCGYDMPHALQTVRDFWQSSRRPELESYLRSIGQPAAADQLKACGPGNVATLDPQHIAAVLGL